MNDRLSSTSVVREIVRETEGFFAEHVYEFLLFLDTLLVKDSAKLVEGILCVTTERRDILRGILPDVDGAGRDGRRCPAARIALDGHGDVRRKAFGVVDLILFVLRHVVIVAVLMVGGTDALCTVVCFVLKIDNSIFLFFLDLLKPFTKDIHP